MKKSLLITAVLGAIAAGIYLFAVEPIEAKLVRVKAELESAESRHTMMMRNLEGAEAAEKRIAAYEKDLAPFKAAMLTPLLESYAMRAKSILDPIALGAGLSDTSYEELPPLALPVPKRLPKQLYARLPVKLTAGGSYQAAVSFLMRLEKEFPLVILQSLAITAGRGNNEQHIVMTLEWPIIGRKTVIEKGVGR